MIWRAGLKVQIMIKFHKFHYSEWLELDCKNEYSELIVTIISVQKDPYVCIKINMLRETKQNINGNSCITN